MTGMSAGRQGEGVTKGFFSGKKNRRGRQLGRVVATLYDEIVAERLYAGTTQLECSLQELVMAAEKYSTWTNPGASAPSFALTGVVAEMPISTGCWTVVIMCW